MPLKQTRRLHLQAGTQDNNSNTFSLHTQEAAFAASFFYLHAKPVMFSFFGKKKKEGITRDLVFISTAAKQKAIQTFLDENPGTLLLTWFEESYDEASRVLPGMGDRISLVRELPGPQLHQTAFIFYEHHPLMLKEKEWLEKTRQEETVFYSSLDEPLFLHAGGAHIASLVQKLGMQEDEAISHPMISKSINNARKKLSEKIFTESPARSQQEWFKKNVKENS